MSNAVAQAALAPQVFPLNTVAGGILFELLSSGGTVVTSQTVGATAADTAASATFSNVAPGTGYTVRATRVDNSGAALAVPVVSSPVRCDRDHHHHHHRPGHRQCHGWVIGS